MTRRIDDSTARARALDHLALFCDRILPGTVRRIIAWKQLSPRALPDMCDEARQELAVDCLQNYWQLAVQPQPLLHARWMRLAERMIYRQWVARRWQTLDESVPARPERCLSSGGIATPVLDALRNGRANVMGSARRRRVTPRSVRAQLDEIAERLGQG
ncbi:MAG: hypothetical protein WBO45_12100, partial [Planctomycetota bacterium]